MGQNVEVKDVHQTEYLDKNGLDMLWAKIKENAHNQVEVERNRAVAKENSITNSLNEFVRKTSDDDQTINSNLMIIGGIGIAAENIENTEGVGLTPTRVEFSHANNRSSIQLLGIDVDRQNGSAIEIKTNCENPYITLSDGTNDNHDNGQTLSITNKGITCNNHTQNDEYFFAANGEIKDIYNTLDINIHRNFREGIDTSVSNEGLSVFRNTVDGTNGIKITDSGILVNSTLTENSSPNKVFATDGSIADLAQYAKKSDITAGGKYIPYESINDNTNDKTYVLKRNEGILFKSGSGNISIKDSEIEIGNNVDRKLSVTPNFIWLQEITDNGNRETLLVELNENGLRLRGGDNNHVLTSYGSTIDITQYVLKSVYDEKIAALEARITALEAKHAETA